ncbi:hypothetical protein EPA93_42785 [Ktedonosporobacter rubrisoli]|uniref:4-vinyl reductase 4VR domain-containing protein n=1 Tax=Ktedonosporobacter rubrisoli TaxID=2509675 RepID=A0A4P6K499_KTERU|nr:heme NO-binding domain-containing protein [Ktedonosporobacter rubrisoli]QBD82346.1 hypothetical protein EPA93_42785 [Ktedonosporobacter rubrisoli]
MHGLVFVTWERFLGEKFGSSLLASYRNAIGETAATAPLANRVYEDQMLLAGVGVASQLTRQPVDTLLRGYGHYFISNAITGHLCSYLLSQIHTAKDLLLTMRAAHAQLRRTPDALKPPLFGYEMVSSTSDELILIYDSYRRLCPLLMGAIEGAAARYGEQAHVIERTCMRHGAATCRFEVRFTPLTNGKGNDQLDTRQQERQQMKRELGDLLLQILPDRDGVTLADLQRILQQRRVPQQYLRPYRLLEGLQQLQYVGLISSTVNQPSDDLIHRRYWKAPTVNDHPLAGRNMPQAERLPPTEYPRQTEPHYVIRPLLNLSQNSPAREGRNQAYATDYRPE